MRKAESICGRLTLTRSGKLVLDGAVTNFYLTEMVSRREYKLRGRLAILHLNPEMVKVTQMVREYYDVSLTMNNWFTGGKYNQRGFRSAYTKVGSDTSGHRFGLAGDVSSPKITADELRQGIMDDHNYFYSIGLTRIEDGAFSPSWLHYDLMPTTSDRIEVIKPV